MVSLLWANVSFINWEITPTFSWFNFLFAYSVLWVSNFFLNGKLCQLSSGSISCSLAALLAF
jgi:hypothetical protein